MSDRTALYCLYNSDDELLYIGIAFSLSRRYNQHRKTKPWWPEVGRRDVCWFETRLEAENAERRAILDERPRYNTKRLEGPLTPAGTARTDARRRPPTDPDMLAALGAAARADKRADTTKERTAQSLRETILAAADAGMKPSEIRDAIERRYSDGHLSRMIHGKA
jgi:hypothetical protein